MIFRQITHDDLGCASYLVGDDDAAVAAVVDPRLDIDEYLRLARYLGVRIEHVLETHNHADHVSGHGRLAASTGATIHIHRAAAPEYDHEPFDDGWELALGTLVVRAVHTPGHRPEHTAFALVDTERGPEPWAVLTGDSLFVGGIARPDLAVDPREGAHGIFHSLHDGLLDAARHVRGVARAPRRLDVRRPRDRPQGVLDDRLRARPPGGARRSSTRRSSSSARSPGSARSRRTSAPSWPSTPGRWPAARRRSIRSRRARSSSTSATARCVVDVRTELQFDDAHIPGAICITVLRAGFGSRLAWLADHDQPVVVVGRDDDDARGAIGLAASVGVTNVAGYLAGGMTSWREDQLRVARIPRMTVPELHERWEEGPPLQVLDVRERSEWERGHIPGAVHTPYHDIHALPRRASTPTGPSRSSARRGSAPRWAPACWPATARARSSTSSTAAWAAGGAQGWPLEGAA